MSLFYSAYFINTQEPEGKLKERFAQVEAAPGARWMICDWSDDYVDGAFEPGTYFTLELSRQFGEAIFMCVDTMNDQFDYEHSQHGVIRRKLSWVSDGCRSTWEWVEGEPEAWEQKVVFSEDNFARTLEIVRYDDELQPLPEDELQEKIQELRALWAAQQYVIGDDRPYGDATMGMAIEQFFGIETPLFAK